MDHLFGIPTSLLAGGLAGLTAAAAVVILLLALRHPILVKLGIRQIPRRRARSLLIVAGLALSTTLVAASFITGDTLGATMRALVAGSLGNVDEVVVSYRGDARPFTRAALEGLADGRVPIVAGDDFAQTEVDRVADLLKDEPGVAGIAGVLIRQYAIADPDRQTISAALTLLAVPPDLPAAFGRPVTTDGAPAPPADLAAGEVYLNAAAATTLDARAGDALIVYRGNQEVPARVRAIVTDGELGGTQPTVLAPLAWWQAVEGKPGQINQVLIVNQGGSESLRWSAPIARRLRATLVDHDAAARLFQILATASVREGLRDNLGRQPITLRPRLERLIAALDQPAVTDEFKTLVGDPQVLAALRPVVSDLGPAARRQGAQGSPSLGHLNHLTVVELKQLSLDTASRFASALTAVFLILGLLSIATGIMLVCLIFALLAAERRPELGMARALGTRRGHLVQIFLFEGALYDVLASLLGVLAGLGVAVVTTNLLGSYLSDYGLRLERSVEPRSLVIAFCLGLLLTFGTVTLAAWRIARLNIVAAVRNLPDEPARPSDRGGGARRRPVALLRALVRRGPLLAGVGLALALGPGQLSGLPTLTALGWSLALVGIGLSLRWILEVVGVRRAARDRIAFTLIGLGLLLYWAQPVPAARLFPTNQVAGSLELLALAGLVTVLGAVIAVTHNLETLAAIVTRPAARLRRAGPAVAALSLAAAYPIRHRGRTGLTILMFALVMCTVTTASVLLAGTRDAYADLDVQAAGFDLRAYVDPDRLPDLPGALATAPAIAPDTFAAVGGQANLPVEAVQLGAPVGRWAKTSVQVVDAGWLSGVAVPLTQRAPGYPSDAAVWAAVRETPGLAILHGSAVVSRETPRPAADPLGTASFTLQGLTREDQALAPTVLWLRDPRGGPPLRLTVIGILDSRTSLGDGLYTTPATLQAGGWTPPPPRAYYFKLAPGHAPRPARLGLTKSFGGQGLTATVLAEELRTVQGIRLVLNQILQGFLGLGLVSGVVALGVIATRAVVERRQQIGVLRAIGFGRGLVQATFLLESTLVAGLGLAIGGGLGILLAHNVVRFIAAEHPELRFGVPWDQLGLIALMAYAATLLTTFLPAWQAGRVYPAEALRYE